MKKILTIIISLIIVVIIGLIVFCIWMYNEEQENKRLDAEAVTLKDNLTIEFGKEAKVSDFLENLNGTLFSDDKIDTEKLGDMQVSFKFVNIKNKLRTATEYFPCKRFLAVVFNFALSIFFTPSYY